MLFSSISLLYRFLPMVLAVYFVVPVRYRNGVLLCFSLGFYFVGEPVYTLLLLFCCLQGYFFARYIQLHRGSPRAKAALILSVCLGVSLLAVFKYADLFLSGINSLLGTKLPLLKLALPIGISFYTFQTMSYVVDVYRGDAEAERRPVPLFAYVSMFPQLVAGPIVRYTDVAAELRSRRHSWSAFGMGVQRFAIGLGKKVLFANTLGELCDTLSAGSPTVLAYWLIAIAYMLQIYFDFSGYSDMAIGLGHMFGFHFPENFHYPFLSRSITEFWRRWHMTLGSWFRDYVYIPLGGNRVNRLKWVRNLLVVWGLTGLWHGASWNFLLWGLYFGVLLIGEKLFWGRFIDKNAFLGHSYTLILVTISFVLFRSETISQCLTQLSGMFGFAGLPFSDPGSAYYLHRSLVLLLLALIGASPLPKLAAQRLFSGSREQLLTVAAPLWVLSLMLIATGYLVDGSYNPFLYFRF